MEVEQGDVGDVGDRGEIEVGGDEVVVAVGHVPVDVPVGLEQEI